jgi:hypothetical protein
MALAYEPGVHREHAGYMLHQSIAYRSVAHTIGEDASHSLNFFRSNAQPAAVVH